MNTSLTAQSWKRLFGSALPAGFLARNAIPERWLRIHSLPKSKRYAQSEKEQEELIARHNAVASYTLGESSACALFIARFGESQQWSEAEDLPLNGEQPVHVMAGTDPDEPVQFFAIPVVWHEGAFNDLIVASSEDQTGPLLFANLSTGAAYAPYDGGADLFFPSPAAVGEARSRFSRWLSARGDGL
jgi:hypothetical protein